MSTVPDKIDPPDGLSYGEPTWDVARLFPAQGTWTEQDYLDLDTNQLVEFSHGFVEFLPMPTTHSSADRSCFSIASWRRSSRPTNLGEPFLAAPYECDSGKGSIASPTSCSCARNMRSRITDEYWDGADLVMEVVSDSDDDRRRDLVKKREEYAQARIPEYWIVDPELGQITVLTLDGPTYAVHGEFAEASKRRRSCCPALPWT